MKMILLKISESSQENTCTEVAFVIKLQESLQKTY